MSGSAGNANWRPWRMPRTKPSRPWKKSTTATCWMIRRLPPAPCRVFMLKPSQSTSAALGRWGCPTFIPPILITLPNTPVWRRLWKALPIISSDTYMNGARREQTFRDEELLADVIARLIGDVRHIAVGNASPIPATAALIARERGRLQNLGRPYVSLLQSRKHNFFTDGARELFDCAGQGRIDVFFLSGGQIDGEGNVNLVSTGDYEHPKVRFPGSFGSAYLYYVVPKVILFRTEHSRRTLVPKVDFISAPGASDANVYRTGGPICLITNRCLFDFDRARRRFRLASLHPGHSLDEVIEHTGFDFDRPDAVPITPAPDAATLRLLRTVVAPMLAEVYPEFARRVFGVAAPLSPTNA